MRQMMFIISAGAARQRRDVLYPQGDRLAHIEGALFSTHVGVEQEVEIRKLHDGQM
jgi:hypothetical protein